MTSVVICCVHLTGKQSFKELAPSCWQNWFWQDHWTAFDVSWQAKHKRWLFASLQ